MWYALKSITLKIGGTRNGGVGMFRLFLILPMLLGLAACTENFSWKHKVTVVVETPHGDVSGSAVQSIEYTKATWAPAGMTPGSEAKIKAEAVVVALPDGHYLFALLKGANFRGSVENIMQSIVAPKEGARTIPALELASSQPVGLKHAASGKTLPLLVTFGDITKPETARPVPLRGLSIPFGPGYALKSITLEITDEPVTEGRVHKVLGWLNDPNVMENPGWLALPIESRRAIGGLLSRFPKLSEKE